MAGALSLVVGAAAMLQIAAPSPASAAPVAENFASYTPTFGVYVDSTLTSNITQPALVAPGATYTMSVGSNTQAVATSLSGFPIGYTTNLKIIIPVPSGATYRPGTISTGLTWTFVDKGVTTHGPFSLVYCTAASSSCNASPHSSTFLAPSTVPYFETTTGSTHFAGGGTLTMPAWSASFTATGTEDSSIQPTANEYDYTDNVVGLGVLTAIGYPAGVFTAPDSDAPPYLFQPLATSTIGTSVPVVSAVLPNAGPVGGGSVVTIHGSNLNGATRVQFGSRDAKSFSQRTPDSLTAVAPPGSPGTVDVRVTNSSGKSAGVPGDHFTYTHGPIVTGVTPSSGPPAGGTAVVIHGQQLDGATSVDFGARAATSFKVDGDTSITATSPAGSGVVDVTVHNALGGSILSSQDRFSYRSGYLLAASDGGIFAYGHTPFEGSAGALPLNKPVVGMAPTPDAGGYWLTASDGGVFAYGDASFFGSAGALPLNKPVVGMAATPDGFGYWLVASDGGVFSYGDAVFYGSTGGTVLNQPIVGMASTPDGGGYWMVAADGGVFSFGDATFYGSMGGTHLNAPVIGMASTPDGRGYWLVSSDGGVFSFGDATFHGSAGSLTLNKPVTGMAANPDGRGYWLVASDGGVFSYGNAPFYGSAGGLPLNQPVVSAVAG
jgi:hypothetical protein